MPHQPIRLSDGFDFIELEVLELGTVHGQNEGDLRLRVSVRSHDFHGHYDQVWIAQPDWLSFTGSLRRLERDRTGRASVQAMSPDEFELNLQIINRAGHLVVHGYLSRYHFWPGAPDPGKSRIAYRVDLDPSMLLEWVDQFSDLSRAG